MACAGFSGTRQAAYDDADNCDEEYPGDPACDELREFGDNFLASVVSILFLNIMVCLLYTSMCVTGDQCTDTCDHCYRCSVGGNSFSIKNCWYS